MKKVYTFTPSLRITGLSNMFYRSYEHPYYFPGEFHPFWEMVYVMEGRLQAASEARVYQLRKGEMILHRPMEFHRLWSVEGENGCALIIGFSAEGNFLDELGGGAFSLTEKQRAELERVRDYLAKEFPDRNDRYLNFMLKDWQNLSHRIQIFTNLLEIFLLSLTDTHTSLAPQRVNETEDALLYHKIVECLCANVSGWISIEEISANLHCSRSRVNRVFSEFSDIGVHKYLLKLKCAAAASCLRKGMSPGEVSAALSFPNQNYFSTVFKRETGFSPTEYLKSFPEKIDIDR